MNKSHEESQERQMSYVDGMNVSRVKKFHFSAHVVSAVLDLSVHASHLLSLEALQLSQKLFL